MHCFAATAEWNKRFRLHAALTTTSCYCAVQGKTKHVLPTHTKWICDGFFCYKGYRDDGPKEDPLPIWKAKKKARKMAS